jgi:hypothetical protein
MNAINELLVAVCDPAAVQDGFAQLAQDTSFDGAKSHPVDEQSSGFPDDFVLEKKIFWLEDMCSKIRFQLEERMQPCAITCEYGRAVAEDGEGGGSCT